MKKTVFTAAAILLAASCTRELPETTTNQNENLVPFTIENATGPVLTAADKASGSKTVLGNIDGSVVNWTSGDNAILFDNSGSCAGHLFTGTVQGDATKLSLSGEVDEGSTAYWLLYPYNSGASMSEGVITTTLSASQTAVAGSFADKTAISLAYGTRTPGQKEASGLSFNNLCPLITFAIPEYVENAQSVTITAKSGTAMAGTIRFDASTGAMTSVSGSSSITLNGPLAAGARYFVVVAPTTYTDGFNLTLTTAGNNSYSASTTKTIEAAPGQIYNLGTLGLKLDVTPTVTFKHSYSGNILTGSTATLNIPVASELASMISAWTVTLKNSNNTIVRNYTSNSGTGSIANGYTYLPKGTYTVTATYTTLDGRSKPLTLTPTEVTNNEEPSFNVNATGYTSYNYGVGFGGYSKNVNTANGLDGSSIYGLGASVTISADLMNDSKYNKSFTYSFDEGDPVSISGNSTSIADKSGQSWKEHTLSASCTFDGTKVDSETCRLHVTGLPWTRSSSFTASEWSLGSWNCKVNSTYLQLGGVSGSGECSATLVTPFYCPANIGVKLTINIKIKTASLLNQNEAYAYVGGSKIISQMGPKGTAVTQTYNGLNSTGTLTTSNSNIKFEGRRSGANSIVEVSYINLIYN